MLKWSHMKQSERRDCSCGCHMPQEPLKVFQWYHRPASEGTQAVQIKLISLFISGRSCIPSSHNRKAGNGQNHCEAREGGLKTFLNLKCFFAFILFYYLHNYFKCMSIILFTIHRVVCNDIFRGDNPQMGGGGGGGPDPHVPPAIYTPEHTCS